MSELLYYQDSYIREFEARVTRVDEENRCFVLDRTAFYPGGGGQPCDTGSVTASSGQLTVERVKKSDGDILHYTAEGLPSVGETVRGNIDWERRHQLMRTHTAMHVLCGVMWLDHQSLVTGGNMDPLSARMDFEMESLSQEMLPQIEERVNEEIAKNHPVTAAILPREEAFEIPDLIRTKINLLPEGIPEIRTIEIQGLDLQADGGTHVAFTGEVGRVRLVKFRSKGKINKRLYVEIE